MARADASPQEQFIHHIERYGPDTTDSSTLHYQVQLYCRYGGKQCQATQVRARNFQDQRNRAAEQANLRRVWQTQGPGGGESQEEFGSRSGRTRSARATSSTCSSSPVWPASRSAPAGPTTSNTRAGLGPGRAAITVPAPAGP